MSAENIKTAVSVIFALFNVLQTLLNALGVGTDAEGNNNYSQYITQMQDTLNNDVIPAAEKMEIIK